MTSAPFTDIPLAPADPILGITDAFNADTRPAKVNLGVGVYYDTAGHLPVLQCVKAAEDRLAGTHRPRGYLPGDGIARYNSAVQALLFGEGASILKDQRVATAQSLGGTGALRIGADLLRTFLPANPVVLCSDPTWENHRSLFAFAGFDVRSYPYFDAANGGIARERMMAALEQAPAGAVLILHACCHNPTGADLQPEDWDQVIDIARRRQLIPFLDIAYQGFGSGIDADAGAVRKFAASGLKFLVASSFSKSFSLYGERVGAISVVMENASQARNVQSQLRRIVRANYSSPATHGGATVSTVLNDPALRQQWEAELGTMRDRIRAMRAGLRARLESAVVGRDFAYVTGQTGMFSYTGLSAAQVERMKVEFGVYAVSSGRICVAAINDGNIDQVSGAMASVIRD